LYFSFQNSLSERWDLAVYFPAVVIVIPYKNKKMKKLTIFEKIFFAVFRAVFGREKVGFGGRFMGDKRVAKTADSHPLPNARCYGLENVA
jgi:hypothetical protein